MKYILTLALAISSITIAQDAPQIPGWGVYVGGAMNGIAVDSDPEGLTYGRELNMPFVGVSRGIQIPGFPIPLLVGGGLGMRGYNVEYDGTDAKGSMSSNWLDVWATVPYPVGPVIAQVGLVYGTGLGSGKSKYEANGETTEEDLEGEFGDETDLGLLLGGAYPINEKIGINFGYALGLKDHGSDGMEIKYNGLYLLLGYNF